VADTPAPHAFPTLDAFRGVAALIIVSFHMSVLAAPIRLPNAPMAVDLFFMLSGFVIAHSYDRRFAEAMGATKFMRIRLIRLYPLYLAGTALGIAVFAAGILTRSQPGWDWLRLIEAAATNGLMLPSPVMDTLFPFNPPAWSLFFELLVNLGFALLWRPLARRAILLMTLCLIGLALGVATYLHATDGTLVRLDSWSGFLVSLLKSSFGFLMGVAIYRYVDLAWLRRLRVNPWLLILVLGLVLCAPRGPLPWQLNLSVYGLIFPLLIALGAACAPAPRWTGLYSLLGLISYALYILHVPLRNLATILVHYLTHVDLARFAPLSGIAVLIICVLLAWIAARLDSGVRRRLTGWLVPSPTALPA
jgi:peptidoglycan/LPS O-acetylase OafA/YrhL